MSTSCGKTKLNASDPVLAKLLLVDDDSIFRNLTARNFRRRAYCVYEAATGIEALAMAEKHEIDVVILDVSMPGMNGFEVLLRLKETNSDAEVIMLTGDTTAKTAVGAIKLGAIDYINKPVEMNELVLVVEKACEAGRLRKENRRLKSILKRNTQEFSMIGKSKPMQEVFRLIERAGPTDTPILIQGESGTGKELVARALHNTSLVADKPIVTINCATLSESLLESELFGHEKGAFTGAITAKEGLFEVADGGTLFIDEIGEMAGSLQAKLLRVLQDGSLRRVGSVKERNVNVRIICATNRNMRQEVTEGRFREDLFYRIDVMTLKVPPLRERQGDLPLLVQHFAGDGWEVSVDAMEALAACTWPGNIRQLMNAIERAKILADDNIIHLENLPPTLSSIGFEPPPPNNQLSVDGQSKLSTLQRDYIISIMRQNGGNKARSARVLGISRRTLYRLLERHAIPLNDREYQPAEQY